MDILKIVISFVFCIGILGILIAAFSVKKKTALIVILNALVGFATLVILSLTNSVVLPLNPLNAALTGLFGVPGLILVYLLVVFL